MGISKKCKCGKSFITYIPTSLCSQCYREYVRCNRCGYIIKNRAQNLPYDLDMKWCNCERGKTKSDLGFWDKISEKG